LCEPLTEFVVLGAGAKIGHFFRRGEPSY